MILNRQQFIEMLRNHVGSTMVTITARTPQKGKMYAKNPFRETGVEVIKVSRVNACMNFIYEKSVNRQRNREELEADFVAMPRKWGTRVFNGAHITPLIEHKGEIHSVELKIEKSLGYHYEN